MATLSQWVQGARPRTLPAALAPVAAGTGVPSVSWGAARRVDWALVAPGPCSPSGWPSACRSA